MKIKKLKNLIMLLIAMLAMSALVGCGNGETEEDYFPEVFMTGEQFVEIMESNGAFVTDMSEWFPGIFIATDSDTPPMEMGVGRDYGYLIIFNSSDDRERITEEYNFIMEMLEREEKSMSEFSEENGIIRYEFISDRLGYNLIVKASNILIQADGPEASRGLINSLVSSLGF